MRLLGKVLLSPITGPVWTAGFVAKRINEQVDAEYLDEGKVQAELLDLTLQYDRGEIDDEEYKEREAAILEHLNDIRAYKEQRTTGDASDASDASDSDDADMADATSGTSDMNEE
jgi:hypothetical protein